MFLNQKSYGYLLKVQISGFQVDLIWIFGDGGGKLVLTRTKVENQCIEKSQDGTLLLIED